MNLVKMFREVELAWTDFDDHYDDHYYLIIPLAGWLSLLTIRDLFDLSP